MRLRTSWRCTGAHKYGASSRVALSDYSEEFRKPEGHPSILGLIMLNMLRCI